MKADNSKFEARPHVLYALRNRGIIQRKSLSYLPYCDYTARAMHRVSLLNT